MRRAAQNLLNVFTQADANGDGLLNFAEAQAQIAGLTQAQFDALDLDGNKVLSRAELLRTVNSSTGCNCASDKLTPAKLRDLAGDLLLLGCATLVLLCWPTSRNRNPRV
jgi:hypothetical protein